MVHDSNLPGNLQQRIEFVWAKVQKAYCTLGVPVASQVPLFKMKGIFVNDGPNPTEFPVLSAKAAQCRRCVPAVRLALEELEEEFDLNGIQHRHRLMVLKCLDEFYEIVVTSGFYLSTNQYERVFTLAATLLLHHCALTNAAISDGRALWNVVPKHHYFYHLAYSAGWCNPATGWTYVDEDFVGKVAFICKSTVKSLGPLRLGMNLVWKLRRLLWIRVKRFEGDV